jgi:hypothetical protein
MGRDYALMAKKCSYFRVTSEEFSRDLRQSLDGPL